MESARRNKLKALDDLKKTVGKKRHDTRVERIFVKNLIDKYFVGWGVILYWNYFGLLPGFDYCCRGGREFLLHLLLDLPFMDESYACPWLTANSFFYLFLRWNFWDILLFQRLNHFATIRAWKSTSRLVYLERSGRPPFSTYTRAGRQAGRRVYQPSVFVTTNVCVCVWVAQ